MAEVEFPTLENPPISLAVLEILYESNKDVSFFNQDNLYKYYQEDFPLIGTRRTANISLDEEKLQLGTATTGFNYTNAEEKLELALTKNSFALKFSGKYKNWDEFTEFAKKYWAILVDRVKPTKVRRISVRYINTIELDFQQYSLKDLTHTYIQNDTPSSEPKPISQYFFRLTYNYKDVSTLLTHYTQELKSSAEQVRLIIDIDVLNRLTFEENKLDQIWPEFDRLREYKNKHFFDNLGPILKDKFKLK